MKYFVNLSDIFVLTNSSKVFFRKMCLASSTSFQYNINEDYIYLRVKLQAQSVKTHVQFMLPKRTDTLPCAPLAVTVLLSSSTLSEVSRRYDVFHPLMRTACAPNNFKYKQLL